MKTVHTLLSLVVIVLTVGCYEHGVPALFVGESQPEPAEQRHFMVSLEELNEALPMEQWEQFFEERAASSLGRQLQGLDNKQQKLALVFELHQLEQEGVGDEVGAGIIRYLASYHNDRVNALQILGSAENENKRLTSLDPAIGELKSLQVLYLYNNQLQALPAEIGQLKSLQKLYLSNNQLRALPTEIGQLKSLQKLHLPNNQLQALPVEIRQLESLQRLWLAYNQLQALPAEIGQLESIQELYLSNNQLTCLSEKLYPLFQQGKVSATSQNPWLQPTNLRPEDPDSLAAKAYKPLPRSLRTLCTLSIDTAQLTLEQQQKLPYPQFLKEKREEGRKECQWNEGKGIVYFYQGIPFYLDRQLCTPQDVEPMLKELEGKQCYRLPEDLSRQQWKATLKGRHKYSW